MFTVQKDEAYIAELETIAETYQRVNELDDAIVWALERKPANIPTSICITGNWYIWTTSEFSNKDLPSLRIIYEIREDDIVHLQSIDVINE